METFLLDVLYFSFHISGSEFYIVKLDYENDVCLDSFFGLGYEYFYKLVD